MAKKISWFSMAIFFLVFSASPCMSFGYTPNADEINRILKLKGNLSQTTKKESGQKIIIRGGEPPKENKSGETSISINGHNVKSNNPIVVLPPGSGKVTVNPGENKTYYKSDSSGNSQAVGQDVSVTPNQ